MELPDAWENFRDRESFRELYFLGIALVLAFGTLQTTGTALNTDQPVVSVVSCSMYPDPGETGLDKGDILLVEGTDFGKIEEGDTIVYSVPDRIEFTVSGQSFVLEKNDSVSRPSASTPVGEITLVQAVRGNGAERVLLEVDGERVTATEGESLNYGVNTLEVNGISSMPIPVVHRVVDKQTEYLETKGINNPGQLEFEKNVRPFQVHGTVLFKIPKVGLIKILAMDFVGFSGDRPFVFDRYSACEVEA